MLSAPSGSPWALAEPCFAGQPYPIWVFTIIIEGLEVSAFASSIAFAIAATSFPSSTFNTCHPYAS